MAWSGTDVFHRSKNGLVFPNLGLLRFLEPSQKYNRSSIRETKDTVRNPSRSALFTGSSKVSSVAGKSTVSRSFGVDLGGGPTVLYEVYFNSTLRFG